MRGIKARPAASGPTVGAPLQVKSTTVATSESTSATSYGDLSTAGPSVDVDVPNSGEVMLFLTGQIGGNGFMGFALSGANTLAANDDQALRAESIGDQATRMVHLTGLTPGTTTVTARYRSSSGSTTFQRRTVSVAPLPAAGAAELADWSDGGDPTTVHADWSDGGTPSTLHTDYSTGGAP